jgi:hypothetical protein
MRSTTASSRGSRGVESVVEEVLVEEEEEREEMYESMARAVGEETMSARTFSAA